MIGENSEAVIRKTPSHALLSLGRGLPLIFIPATLDARLWSHAWSWIRLNCKTDYLIERAIRIISLAIFSGERIKSIHPLAMALFGISGCPAVSSFWEMV